MHLTSILEPTASKSNKHYAILHYNDRCDLITLPESYSDLEAEVERLYHVDRGRFHIETQELNLCRGKRVRIPKGAWDDVARLLGNIHVLPVVEESEGLNPESGPPVPPKDSDSETEPPLENGEITLGTPLEEDGYLVLKFHDIDFDTKSTPSTRFTAQVLDENQRTAVAVNILPVPGWISLTSPDGDWKTTRSLKEAFPSTEHSIILRKDQDQFLLICDFHLIGSVPAIGNTVMTTVAYDLGVQSPFKGPISVEAYPDLPQLIQGYSRYRTLFPVMNKGTLYQRIAHCNPQDASQIPRALFTIRREAKSFDYSSSGIAWHGQRVERMQWVDFEWNMSPQCIFVARITYLGSEFKFGPVITFGPQLNFSLQIKVGVDGMVKFDTYQDRNQLVELGTLALSQADHFLSPGEHTITLVVQDDNDILVIFDFCECMNLSDTNMVIRQPNQMYFYVPEGCILDVDVYEFG